MNSIEIMNAISILNKFACSDNTYTVRSWLEEWLTLYKIHKLKSGTLRDYRLYMTVYIFPALGQVRLIELEGITLQKFINSITKDNIRKKVAFLLNSALKKAVSLRLLPFNPFDSVELPRASVSHYKPLTFESQDKIFAVCCEKYKAFFFFMCCTGLRIGEFLALDLSKDISKREVRVTKTIDIDTGELISTPKTENSVRNVAILPELLPYVETLRKNVYTYSGCRNYFRRLYKKMKLVGYNIHSFRHTFASVCCFVGYRPKTVQFLIGHSDIKLTMNLYTHVLRKGKSVISEYLKKLKKIVE